MISGETRTDSAGTTCTSCRRSPPTKGPSYRQATGARSVVATPLDAAAGPGDEGGRAPRARLVRGDEELVAVAVRLPAPVGLRRAGVGGDGHREARPARAAPGKRAGLALAALDTSSRRAPRARAPPPRAPVPPLLNSDTATPTAWPGRHEAVVGPGLEHEALGQGEGGLDVLLLLPQALGDLGAGGGLGHAAVELRRERAHARRAPRRARARPSRESAGSKAARAAAAFACSAARSAREGRARARSGRGPRASRVEAVEDVGLGRGRPPAPRRGG